MPSTSTEAKAAGVVLMTTPDKRALFLLRGDKENSPLTWAFPGGRIEEGETPEDAVIREVREETGWTKPEDLKTKLEEKTKQDGYITFRQKITSEFIPTLNKEHSAYAWAPLDNPPQPLHPNVEKIIGKLAEDNIPGLVTTPNSGIPLGAMAEGEDQSMPFNSTTDVTYPLFLDEYSFDDKEVDVSKVKIDETHDVDWISDMSKNCKIMYKDKDFEDEIQNNGKTLKTSEPLLRHEKAECEAMHRMLKEFKEKHGREPDDKERNKIYDDAHENFGLVAEKQYIEENDFDWKVWNAFTAGKLAHLEHKNDKNKPPDSDVAKFPGGGSGELMFTGDIDIIVEDNLSQPQMSFDGDPFHSGKPIRHGLRLFIVKEPINFLDELLIIA
jgi:8-oxo-dGTP pyrophosphatase MutT (NUDIX family)